MTRTLTFVTYMYMYCEGSVPLKRCDLVLLNFIHVHDYFCNYKQLMINQDRNILKEKNVKVATGN